MFEPTIPSVFHGHGVDESSKTIILRCKSTAFFSYMQIKRQKKQFCPSFFTFYTFYHTDYCSWAFVQVFGAKKTKGGFTVAPLLRSLWKGNSLLTH